jgi:hypothetical protein
MRDYLSGGKIYDLMFKGFRYQSEIAFLKNVKKVLVEAFKSDEYEEAGNSADAFVQTLRMIGPLFSINSDVKVDFSHQDLAEIINHDTLK